MWECDLHFCWINGFGGGGGGTQKKEGPPREKEIMTTISSYTEKFSLTYECILRTKHIFRLNSILALSGFH